MGSNGKSLRELASLVSGELVGDGDMVIRDVTHDSRQAGPGALYVAIEGARADGHLFAGDAVSRGAEAVCVTRKVPVDVPKLLVKDTRLVLGRLSAAVHDEPSRALDVIGVTGTNGKTTVTHYCESIARTAGLAAGLIGTIETRIDGRVVSAASHTTPEASDFQRLLAEMRDSGVTLVAAEVSSHALEFGRVADTKFEVAAFTNLSQDHLDFHGDMATYREAKRKLFQDYEVGMAVFNIEDSVGLEFARDYAGPSVEVGAGGDVTVSNLLTTDQGSSFSLETPWGSHDLAVPVLGAFNVSNLAVAAACCLAAGIEFDDVMTGMREVSGVPGRFEVIGSGTGATVIVDYAHTPDGISAAVETARGLGAARVIALVGAGGDRDRDKRPRMGRAVSAADLAVVTSDNPRSEDPQSIVDQVVEGVSPGTELIVDVDRRSAIRTALATAGEGDVVLILGRGHESHQLVGDQKIPFRDRDVVLEILEARSATKPEPAQGSMST